MLFNDTLYCQGFIASVTNEWLWNVGGIILTGYTSIGLGLISGLRGEMRATNALSHGTASWEDGGVGDGDVLRCMFNRMASDKTYRQNVIIPDASSTKFLKILVLKFEETSSG